MALRFATDWGAVRHMPECERALPCDASLLSAYYDDVLDPATRRLVATHLRQCPACRAELAAYERLGDALRALPIAPMRSRLPTDVAARAKRRGGITAPGGCGWP